MRARLLDRWTRRVAQWRQRPLLEAAMAAAALVSMADDDLRLSEELALDAVLERMRSLEVFDAHTAVDLHRQFSEAIARDPDGGREHALETIGRFGGGEDDRLSVLYVAAVLARADLDLSAAEEAMLVRICDRLELEPDAALERIWGATGGQPPARTPSA